MNSRRHTKLQGWTLSETLVMMIVAGVVFTAVMDGVLLFNRYAGRKTKEITGNMRLYEGYYLLRHLAAVADSVSWEEASHERMPVTAPHIGLFREQVPFAALFTTADSMLIVRHGPREETLMPGVSGLRLAAAAEMPEPSGADSIKLTVGKPDGSPLEISFPVHPAASRLIVKQLREREEQYAYE